MLSLVTIAHNMRPRAMAEAAENAGTPTAAATRWRWEAVDAETRMVHLIMRVEMSAVPPAGVEVYAPGYTEPLAVEHSSWCLAPAEGDAHVTLYLSLITSTRSPTRPRRWRCWGRPAGRSTADRSIDPRPPAPGPHLVCSRSERRACSADLLAAAAADGPRSTALVTLSRDPDHHACVDLFTGMHLAGRPMLVPAPVVAEVGYLLHSRGSTRAESTFLRSVAAGDFHTVDLIAEDFARRADLVDIYADLPLGTTDAAVITLAERLGLTEVATVPVARHRRRHRTDD